MIQRSQFLIVALAISALVSVALSATAGELSESEQSKASSLTSRLLPAKLRSPRSLGDMMEKVKNRIFGKKASSSAVAPTNNQQQAGGIASSASALNPTRQAWNDLNAFNQQQLAAFPGLQNFNAWSANSQQSANRPYGINNNAAFNPLGYMNGGQPNVLSASPDSSFNGAMPSLANLDGSPVQASNIAQVNSQPANSNSAGGLLSSASQLFSQYLNPSSNSQANQAQQQQQQQQAAIGGQNQPQQQLNPQHQQSYNDFSSLLDSMVAQSGVGAQQRGSQSQIAPSQQTASQAAAGDQEMSASNGGIASYLQTSGQQVPGQQQAAPSQKSSMVNLAEQLAPGAQFNKLVSFPFSLSSNEDPSKEGRFKLHIPFVNQHVKRSDNQQAPTQQQTANNNQNLAALSSASQPTTAQPKIKVK